MSVQNSNSTIPTKAYSLLALSLGILGIGLNITGALLEVSNTQKSLFLVGAVALLATAAIQRHRLFIYLECVVIFGSALAFISLGTGIKLVLPTVLGLILFWHLWQTKTLVNARQWVGGLGLVILAIGFASSSAILYLVGGITLSVYSAWEWQRGIALAWLWLVLNGFFSVATAYQLMAG